MGKHALLSASSSHRWLACPPSARLCESYEDKGSEYAQQGTDAHSLCEYKLQKALGIKADNPTENLTYYDSEMEVCAESYADYVMEQLAAAMKNCSDPIVLIEQRLDYSRFVPEGFGTGDAIIIADGQLTICDYKHGKGVLVEAEKNPQMMCYALGALELFDALYDIDTVRMVIFQPRRENVSEYIITRTELLQWAEDILVPTAKLAFDGEGEFCAGEHCRFCKVKAACRKRAEYNLELAKYDFETPAMLDDVEIEAVLSKVDELVSWAADVKEFALHAAISGKAWTDWKLVEGRSNRKYVSDEAVATAVTEAGYNPYEEKLLGVTAMTALLGKKNFVEVIESRGLIEKPQGKPVLVPMSDKRPALNTAKQDFNEE